MGKFDAQLKESSFVKDALSGLAKNTKNNYKASLRQFLRFVNSKEDLKKEVSIDNLVNEAKADITKTEDKIDLFFSWLMNNEVKGYRQRGSAMRETSAHQRAYAYLRGFFSNLDIAFQKKWIRSIPKVKRQRQAIKKDQVYTFYDVDEKTKTIHFNRELMQQFLAILKPRDVAITLALLSSSQDSGDLFKLNVGDIREQREKNRIIWEGTRNKTTVQFRTFLSKEATRFIRKYIEQERQNTDDKDPLFVYSYRKNGQSNEKAEKRMTSGNFGSILRDAARKMGIKWENGEQNPLRPKRMRHLFRTAADTAGVNELYVNAFMGHRNHMGQSYSELSKAKLELEYLRVEPFLTVYSSTQESMEIKEDVRKLESRIVDLNREIGDQKMTMNKLKEKIDDVENIWMKKVENQAQRLFNKWADEWQERFQKDIEAQELESESQREMTKPKIFIIDGKEQKLSKLDLMERLKITYEKADEIWRKGVIPKEMKKKLVER